MEIPIPMMLLAFRKCYDQKLKLSSKRVVLINARTVYVLHGIEADLKICGIAWKLKLANKYAATEMKPNYITEDLRF
jgi:hypothetical protein